MLGRFLSPDTIVPELYNTLDWDRYSYVNNNPVRYTDPSGHMLISDGDQGKCKKVNCGWTPSNDSSENNVIQDPSFDSTLGGNKEKPAEDHKNIQVGKFEPVNPPVEMLIFTGILLAEASIPIEFGILYTEVVILPTVALAPPLGTLLELDIGAVGLAIADVNAAYWIYVARVIREPEVKQDIELLPPWGLGQ